MDFSSIVLLIILVIVVIAIIGIIYGVYRIKYAARQFSRNVFGTDTLSQGLKQQEVMLAETPKSISAMTKIYLPQIEKDFPEFNFAEFRQRAENTLKSAFVAIERQDVDLLCEDAGEDLKRQVEIEIQTLLTQGEKEHFERPKIHRTEISRYKYQNGLRVVTLQSAVEYTRWREQGGQNVSGRKDLKTQTKYELELTYIQDRSKVSASKDNKAIGLSCPHCGAPIETVGAKKCLYCGSGIVEINLYAWELSRYYEVKN